MCLVKGAPTQLDEVARVGLKDCRLIIIYNTCSMIQIAELISFIQETIFPRVSVLHCRPK